MYHFVPIICLIIFVLFIEFRLKRDFIKIKIEFNELLDKILKNKKDIKINKDNIQVNKENIEYNKESISKLNE